MSGSVTAQYSNQEIVSNINSLAKEMWPYIQNEEYDNGHILGHNVFQFYSKEAKKTNEDGLIYGTVIKAELQKKPVQIFVTIRTFEENNHRVILPITKERAVDIMLKMVDSKKYIDFIIKAYLSNLEQKESEYIQSLKESVERYGLNQIYSVEIYGGTLELRELLELKKEQNTNHFDAKIQRIKHQLRIAKEFFSEAEEKIK